MSINAFNIIMRLLYHKSVKSPLRDAKKLTERRKEGKPKKVIMKGLKKLKNSNIWIFA